MFLSWFQIFPLWQFWCFKHWARRAQVVKLIYWRRGLSLCLESPPRSWHPPCLRVRGGAPSDCHSVRVSSSESSCERGSSWPRPWRDLTGSSSHPEPPEPGRARSCHFAGLWLAARPSSRPLIGWPPPGHQAQPPGVAPRCTSDPPAPCNFYLHQKYF